MDNIGEVFQISHLQNTCNNRKGNWGNQIRGGKRKGSISIMFHNMGGIGNASYQHIQQKLDTLKHIVINEVISIIELAEVNINWRKVIIK